MKLERTEILENRQIASDMWAIRLRAPQIARHARPGQFVTIRVSSSADPFLRRPLSVYGIRKDGIELLVRPSGRGSWMLVGKNPGDALDCMGPLGNGFTIDPRARNLLMVGGGCGIAPLVSLAEAGVARNLSVVLLYGTRTAKAAYPAELLPSEVEYGVATEDGSMGQRGLVTDLMHRYLEWADAIYACGPHGMFLSLLNSLSSSDIKQSVQLSLEENMGCAVGECFGCAVEIRSGEMKTVCGDGPVFEMRDLKWA